MNEKCLKEGDVVKSKSGGKGVIKGKNGSYYIVHDLNTDEVDYDPSPELLSPVIEELYD